MKEHISSYPEKNNRRRKILLKTNLFILTGYIITQLGTLIAHMLNLTSMSASCIYLFAFIVIFFTLFFSSIIYLKKRITRIFTRNLFFLQYLTFILMYSLWIYHLNEIRIFGLFCALIALTIVLSRAKFLESLLIAIGTALIHFLITFYAIYIEQQTGNLILEIFYTVCFIPSFITISIVAGQMNKQRRDLIKSFNELVTVNETLQDELESNNIEMDLASNIQHSFFIQEPPHCRDWDIAFYFKPKYGVSGDFYDFYTEGNNLTGAALFDVTGHGVSSALITILAKPVIFRSNRDMKDSTLDKVISKANKTIIDEMKNDELYLTGILIRVFDNHIEYVNSAHPDIILKKGSDQKAATIMEEDDNFRGTPLGILDFAKPCKNISIPVTSGDTIILYTDCLVETTNSEKEEFGLKRLISAFNHAPDTDADKILNFIIDKFYSFIDMDRIKDDCTIIVMKKTG